MSTAPLFPEPIDERNPTDELLFELATELVRLPFEGDTRLLHIRALELKRVVGQWARSRPSDTEVEAIRARIAELLYETSQRRRRLR